MTNNTFWIVLAVAALAFAAIWAFLTPPPTPDPIIETVTFEAHNPWMFGNTDDAFSYAGDVVRTVQGTAMLQMSSETNNGTIAFSLPFTEELAVLLGGVVPETSVALRMELDHADAMWTDLPIHGDTGIGDSRLPVTHAHVAGSGNFELLVDGIKQPTEWGGFWSLADALRQSDASIRNQGLVFSPLLRDQSVFSDPTRTEITLLVYDTPESDTVLLHLVFPSVDDRVGEAGS